MTHSVRARNEVPAEYTWDIESVFPSDQAWDDAFSQTEQLLPEIERFRGHVTDSPTALADWFDAAENLFRAVGKIYVYASSRHNVDTTNQDATARNDRAMSLFARVIAASAFAEPEILAIGFETLRTWLHEEPRLALYEHYLDSLEQRKDHVRSAEVEEILGLVQDPFSTASATHRILTDTDMRFPPAHGEDGEPVEVAQGNISALITDRDRKIRQTAWENYADAHLALKNTAANCLAAGVKQDVFRARARRYSSSLEAALLPGHIPVAVFHTLIETYRQNLPIWHRYWSIRRQALGYDQMHDWDIKAPLTANPPEIPYAQAIDWIVAGMRPLGDEYVTAMHRGLTTDRWVDVYPNQGKRSGAYSTGTHDTRPFILMSYTDDIFSMSTLAHELGHSMHSFFSRQTQPFVYSRYGLFVAETASNFNQALVRAHLLDINTDPDFQIAVIEEAMSNFHRYFFIMPSLARFELEIHERVERGQALNADSLIALMADLFAEAYGDEVVVDRDRVGITWAQFSGHLYANFYVFQYATGISAANALAQQVLDEGQSAAERYVSFLKAGGSVYPLDALKMAGVDMTTPEVVEKAFGVMAGYVDRLATLVTEKTSAEA